MLFIAIAIVLCVFIITDKGIRITITHKQDIPKVEPMATQEQLDEAYHKEPEYSFDNVLAEVHKMLDAETEEDNG